MNDEIKEILDLLKYCVEKNEYLEEPNMKNWKVLLDYITNLQEENKELNDDNIWWNNRFKAVERDNRNLKAKLEMYENGVYFSSENDELQQRIDKAVEYIENNTLYSEDYDYDDEDNLRFQGAYDYKAREDLLEILKGSDKIE